MTPPRRGIPYVQGAAIITGYSAEVLAQILASPRASQIFNDLNHPDLYAMRDAVNAAARASAQARRARREDATADADSEALSPCEEITAQQAARLLGVSVRRAQELAAAGGIARKEAGRWVYYRPAVEELGERRAAA